MCGEKPGKNNGDLEQLGSPPRMRGKIYGKPAGKCRRGITPAYAGKSALRQRLPVAGEDHPRVCGEKSIPASSMDTFHGSPPRMRGKARVCHLSRGWVRITPAYAGKSCITLHIRANVSGSPPRMRGKVLPEQSEVSTTKDHPRVCGEKGQPVPAAGLSEGSPPRMRGKVKKTQKGIQSAGITPACAGKSLR